MADNDLNVIPGQVLPARRIAKITTLTGITRELSMVYKLMMKGELPPEVGTKAAYMLNVQAGIVKDARILDEFADRIAMIEAVKG